MQDMYPNLPGILAEFKDGGLQVKTDPNPPTTESVLLLGTAVDGPLLEPVAVDQSTVELVFGKATRPNGLPNGSTLIKGFEQAYQAGCRDIRLMRITGSYAVGTLSAPAITTSQDIAVDDELGAATGNIQTELQLDNAGIIPASVVVNANGVNLPSTAFDVDPGVQGATTPIPGKITLHDNVTDSGAVIYVNYQYQDAAGNVISFSQNGHRDPVTGQITYFTAAGQDVTLQLSQPIKPGSLILYANGVAVDSKGYSIGANGKSIVLHPGFVPMNSRLEANYLTVQTSIEAPFINLKSVYAGSIYNQVQFSVSNITNATGQVVGKLVTIVKPDSKKAQAAEAPLQYSSLDYPSFRLLVDAINSDPNNNVVRASVANRFENEDPANLNVSPAQPLAGGDDGLTVSKQQLFEALGGVRDPQSGLLIQPGAYQLLENYSVDHVVPLGVYADDQLVGKYDNFAAQLALACAVMSFRNKTTVGHITTKSPDEVGLASINDLVNHLLNDMKNDYFMRDLQGNILKDSEGQNIDLGRFINVIAGPDIVFSSPRIGVYAENSAAFYAGFISTLNPQSAATNKAVPAAALRFTFSNSQLDKLTGARFVTYRTKNNGSVIAVTDAMTAAQPTSDYRRLTTVRVVKEAVDQVRDVADPFLGEANDVPHNNALSAAISKRLDSLKAAGIIQDYEFHLIITQQDQVLGQGKIELTIVPPQELRRLTVVVDLKPGL